MDDEGECVEVSFEAAQSILVKRQQEEEEERKKVPNPLERYLNERSETRHVTKDDFYNDEPHHMTWSRRVARCLGRYQWYYPAGQVDLRNLDRAWAFFEHSTLPRRFVEVHGQPGLATAGSILRRRNANDKINRASYGEQETKTKLYGIVSTPEAELADFGLGIGIYFWTLRIMAIITFLAGVINIPNLIYFSSPDYTSRSQSAGTSIGAVGSALCTDTEWVACPTCKLSQWTGKLSATGRFAHANDLTFILKNECDITFQQGLIAWFSLVFVCISVYTMGWVSRMRERRFDEALQTAADYSVEVMNPPIDADDPDIWMLFFSQFNDHVTLVTVALENNHLINAMVKRRTFVQDMKYLIKTGIEFDEGNLPEMVPQCIGVVWWKKWVLWKCEAPLLLEKIRKLEREIKRLASKRAPVSKIFVTFETEQGQRNALKALSVSQLDCWLENKWALPKECLFMGKHVLSVREPPEPNSIRWHNLDEHLSIHIFRLLVAFFLTLSAIAGGAVLITFARKRSALAAAITIKIINQVTPRICRMINNRCEFHSNDGFRQASLYVKMTLFKWVNTAIVTTLVVPFMDTVREGKAFLIHSVWAIFFTEMLTTPLINFSDIWGNIQRHLLGPRAIDQKRMNLSFRGGHVDIAERYTEMTKIIFLCFFYSAIFPAGFFMAAITLSMQYWTDKFALLRSWGPEPDIGSEVADFSRNYFFTTALVIFALMQSYHFAGWPFDNACATSNNIPREYIGTFYAVSDDGDSVQITIGESDVEYSYCFQDMLRFRDPRAFPAVPAFQPDGDAWMSVEQGQIAHLMGWTSVAVISLVGIIFLNRVAVRVLRNLFFKPRSLFKGKAMDERFSDCRKMSGYIPQVTLRTFEFPILATDISDLNPSVVELEDPSNQFPYNIHNLIYDLPGLSDKDSDNSNRIFSKVKQWKPNAVCKS